MASEVAFIRLTACHTQPDANVHNTLMQRSLARHQLSLPPSHGLACFARHQAARERHRLASISLYPQGSGSTAAKKLTHKTSQRQARMDYSWLSHFLARTLPHTASLPSSTDPARHQLRRGDDDGTAAALARPQRWPSFVSPPATHSRTRICCHQPKQARAHPPDGTHGA